MWKVFPRGMCFHKECVLSPPPRQRERESFIDNQEVTESEQLLHYTENTFSQYIENTFSLYIENIL